MDPTTLSPGMTSTAPPMLAGLSLDVLLAVLVTVVVLGVAGVVLALLGRHRASRREHDLHRDLHEQRLDIERREHRLTEREERLDDEAAAVDQRAHDLVATQTALDERRAELLDLEAERRRDRWNGWPA